MRGFLYIQPREVPVAGAAPAPGAAAGGRAEPPGSAGAGEPIELDADMDA